MIRDDREVTITLACDVWREVVALINDLPEARDAIELALDPDRRNNDSDKPWARS